MDTTQEELEAMRRLAELEARSQPSVMDNYGKPKTFMDKVKEYVPDEIKNIGTAAYKGLAALPAMALDSTSGTYTTEDAILQQAGYPPRTLNPGAVSKALAQSGHQAKNQSERYVNEMVKGATGALIPMGGVGALRAVLAGAAGGLAGEGAGQLPGIRGTSSEPYARLAGGVGGSLLTGIPMSRVKNLNELAHTAVGNWAPEQVAAAKAVMEKGRNAVSPVSLNASQGAGFPSNLDSIVESLMQHRQGQPLIDQMHKQPKQIQALANRLEKAVKGVTREPAVIANMSQEAADAAITGAKALRTNRVRPFYEAAGDLPLPFLKRMEQEIQNKAKLAPDSMRGDVLNELADTFTKAIARTKGEPTGLLDAQGKAVLSKGSPVSAQGINESMRSLSTAKKAMNLTTAPIDAQARGALNAEMRNVREQIGAGSPSFKKGNDLYQQLTTELVSPLKKGVVGRIAGRTGAVDDVEAVNKLLPLIAKGRNPKSFDSEILNFAEATKKNPQVLQDAFKTHISNALSKVETTIDGMPSQTIAADLKKQLFATPAQQQGMKDVIAGLAVQQGKNPTQVYAGFMNGLKLIEAASKRPPSLGVGPGDLADIAGKSHFASGVQLLSLNAGNQAGKGMKAFITGRTYKRMAELATTPEGLETLVKLAKLPVMSVGAQTILNTALAGGRQYSVGLQNSNSVENEERLQ